MANQNDRAGKFIKAINEDAYIQQKQIEAETVRYLKTELAKARQLAKDEIDEITVRERNTAKSEISRKYSAMSYESKKEMLLHRSEIMQSVFEDAKKKLCAFAESAEYRDWLINNIAAASKSIDSDDTVLMLRSGDEKYADDIKKAVGESFTVQTDDENTVGGFRLKSKKLGICINDTLQSRLDDEHDWFLKIFSEEIVK